MNMQLTRRDLMKGLATSVISAGISRTAWAQEPPTPLMKRLSEYMSQAESRALPADVLEKTKYHILDTVAAMISGSQLTPGRAAIQFVRLRRRQSGHGRRIQYSLRTNRIGAGKRRDGSCRRDRRFMAFRLASWL